MLFVDQAATENSEAAVKSIRISDHPDFDVPDAKTIECVQKAIREMLGVVAAPCFNVDCVFGDIDSDLQTLTITVCWNANKHAPDDTQNCDAEKAS